MDGKSRLFITVEGGEGCGKTTLMDKLVEAIAAKGLSVMKTREPGGCALSEHVREWVLRPDLDFTIGNRAELFLFLAARAQQVEELIAPALDEGKVVICDRWNDSSVAYQGYGRGLDPKEVREVCLRATDGLEPTLTFFLDVEPNVGLVRSKGVAKEYAKEGQGDRVEEETEAFHERVRRGFMAIAAEEPDRLYTLDASQNQDAVFDEAWRIVDAKLRSMKML